VIAVHMHICAHTYIAAVSTHLLDGNATPAQAMQSKPA
jgi:hypothetical protein